MKNILLIVIVALSLNLFAQDILLDDKKAADSLLTIYRSNKSLREGFLIGLESQISQHNKEIEQSFSILLGFLMDFTQSEIYSSYERMVVYKYFDVYFNSADEDTKDTIRDRATKAISIELRDYDQKSFAVLILLLGTIGDKFDATGNTDFFTTNALARAFQSKDIKDNVYDTALLAEATIIALPRFFSKDKKGQYVSRNSAFFSELKVIANQRRWGWKVSRRLDDQIKQYIGGLTNQ